MNGNEFKNAIRAKRPRYANSRIPILDALANKGSKTSNYYSQFGPVYEMYIYAFMLGLKKKLRLPLPDRKLTSDFLEIGKWKRDSALVDFLMMVIFTNNDEIGFIWSELEDYSDVQLNEIISNIITFIEEYANGGLQYIQELYDRNELENSHYMFIDLYQSI